MDVDEQDTMDEGLNPEEDCSSDDNDDDMEEEKKQIEILEEKLLQSPYEYKSHIDLIQLLGKIGELEKLRGARERMSRIFPLTQALWLEWIEDEKKFADSEEDHSRIVELFEKAVKDYMCPEVWLEYSQYCIRWMSSADGLKRIREVMERSIAAVGLHVNEGAALWEMYREFENALLLNIQPQPGSIPSPEQQEKIKKQTDKISSLFKGQIAVPLSDMENTFQEFVEWSENEIDPGIRHMYEQALKQLEELKPLEDALSKAAPPKLEEYQNYIQHEIKSGSSARVQCVYERALVENCLNSELWIQYLKYMSHQPNPPDLLVEAHLRSVRNCPWTGQLWVLYLLALERNDATKEKLNEVFNEALLAGYTSAIEYVELWRLKCTQIRRRISSGEHGPEQRAELSECFNNAIKYITETILPTFNETGDPDYTMWTFWASCEAGILGNREKATEIFQTLVQEDVDARRKICVWREYFNIERCHGGEDKVEKCRSILRQAVQNCAILPDSTVGGVPDAEVACEMLLNFERQHGVLKDMDESLRRVNNKLSRIAKRKEKEAAAYSEQPKQKEWKQKQTSKRQAPRKRKISDENQNRKGGGPPKQQKRSKDAELPAPNEGFKAPAGLPVRYVKKAKVTPHTEEETPASKSGPPPGFKTPPPPGFKGTPPTGFKGPPPPGFKPPGGPASSDVNNNKDKKTEETEHIQPAPSGSESEADKKTIFVSNLDFKLINVEEKLRKVFCNCGKIAEIRLIKNNKGQFRGFGYIEFSHEKAVQEALKLDRKEIDGRPLFVSPSIDKKKQPNFKVFKYELSLEKHKLFVSNLSFHTSEETLKEKFSEHGAIKAIRIVTNRKGQSKGLAFVEYENEAEAAQAVIKMDGKEIDGFDIKVAISNPPARKPAMEPSLSLGGSREQFKGGRGRGRTQLGLLPRALHRSDRTQNGDKKAESRSSTSSGGMTNRDFAKLLLKK